MVTYIPHVYRTFDIAVSQDSFLHVLPVKMTGYTELASFMSNDHAVFKGFRTLAIRDLLYLQAELVHLEHKYNEIAKSDERQHDERRNYGGQWYLLNSSKSRGFGGQQWELALTIRDRLREYCK